MKKPETVLEFASIYQNLFGTDLLKNALPALKRLPIGIPILDPAHSVLKTSLFGTNRLKDVSQTINKVTELSSIMTEILILQPALQE